MEEKRDLLSVFKTAKQNNSKIIIIPKEISILDETFGAMCTEYGIEDVVFEEGSCLTEIANNACQLCQTIKSVDFSNCLKLKSLGANCFKKCENLENVEFAENNNLEIVKNEAFCESGIKKADFKNSAIKELQSFVFLRCPNLQVVDMSKCKNLEIVGSGVTNMSKNLQLWDMSGCSKIMRFGGNGTHARTFRVNANLEGKPSSRFSQIMFDGDVEFWDNGKNVLTFHVDDKPLPFPGMDRLRLTYTGFYKYSRRLGVEVPCRFLNCVKTKKELDYICKNYRWIVKSLKEIDKNMLGSSYVLLRSLGLFDPKFIPYQKSSKTEIEQYRVILAKNMLFNQLKNHSQKLEFENEDKKQEFFERITKKAQEIAQNPKTFPTQILVEKFVKNNILKNSHKTELLNTFGFVAIEDNVNLRFATFFVQNFNEIMNRKSLMEDDYGEDYSENITLKEIYENFDALLERSNKMIVTRKLNQRFSIEDCNMQTTYDNVLEGNEELAKQCSYAHLPQKGFDWAQNIFEIGKKIQKEQVLKCKDDINDRAITYKIIEKDNPVGLVLGNITNCCQCYDNAAENCVVYGETMPNSCFVAFMKGEKIIGQSWLWYDKGTKTIALDNIEIPDRLKIDINKNFHKEFGECVQNLCDNLFETMTQNGNEVENIIIGAFATDFAALDKMFEKRSKNDNCISSQLKLNGMLIYSDVNKQGQYVVYKNGKKQTLIKDKISAR